MTYQDDNIFAKILRGEIPSHKLYEDADTFAFMDIMPRGDGHCLVIPKKPSRNILDVEEDSLAAVARTTQKLARAVLRALRGRAAASPQRRDGEARNPRRQCREDQGSVGSFLAGLSGGFCRHPRQLRHDDGGTGQPLLGIRPVAHEHHALVRPDLGERALLANEADQADRI